MAVAKPQDSQTKSSPLSQHLEWYLGTSNGYVALQLAWLLLSFFCLPLCLPHSVTVRILLCQPICCCYSKISESG